MELARVMKEEVKRELKKCLEEAQQYFTTLSGTKLALVIDGKCLMYALDPSLRVMLLNLSLNCASVVCCRVSPLQKAQVMTPDVNSKSTSVELILLVNFLEKIWSLFDSLHFLEFLMPFERSSA